MYQMVQKYWERVRNSVHVRAGLIEPQGVVGVRWGQKPVIRLCRKPCWNPHW